jgi:hypothetical protein
MSYDRFAIALSELMSLDIIGAAEGSIIHRLIKGWINGLSLPTKGQFSTLIELLTASGVRNDLLAPLEKEWQLAMAREPMETLRLQLSPGLTEARFNSLRDEIQKQRHVEISRKGIYALIQGSKAEMQEIDN